MEMVFVVSHLAGSAAGASKLFNIAARRMSADFAAHRGTQKAGEVCEELFQHVGVMNLATNVRTFFEPLLTGTKGWKAQCQGQGYCNGIASLLCNDR